MKFTLTRQSPTQAKTACLIVGAAESGDLNDAARQVDEASGGRLSRMIKRGDISTKIGHCHLWTDPPGVAAQRVLVVGAGNPDKFDASQYRQANVAAARWLNERRFKSAASALPDLPVENRSRAWRVRQAALASDWGAYQYRATRKTPPQDRGRLGAMTFFGAKELKQSLVEAAAIAAGVRRARELGNLPANICHPGYLAQQARQLAANHDSVKVQVLARKQMRALGMGALLGVAEGSFHAPKLIVLQYKGAAGARPYALIGKGITFDSGGISIKPAKGMGEMKYDMGGAAGVIGAVEACAQLGLPLNLVAVIPAAENMPDGKSYRPGDVVTSMSGKTIEVLNTDAEGRLILCDAITYVKRFKPQLVIDVATLTGACVVALGKHASGLMSPDDELAETLLKAGIEAHDRAWRLPLWEDYQAQLETPYADLANVGGQGAGAITAGCFLARFADQIRWAHLDVAGTAWDGGTKNGATGRPVGLLVQFLIDAARSQQ